METSITPKQRSWKKSTLTGDALYAASWPCPLFTWNNSIPLGLNMFILTLIIPRGLNMTNVTSLFIYSVGLGNLFKLLEPNIFFAHSFVVGTLNTPSPPHVKQIETENVEKELIINEKEKLKTASCSKS